MVVRRGEIWWAALPEPSGSGPGYKRPILIVQSDEFNKSKINTVIAVVITSNARLAAAPGNVELSRKKSKLPKAGVINVSQIITIDKAILTEKVSTLSNEIIALVDEGLKLVLMI